jgi:HAMP domain-containing protein
MKWLHGLRLTPKMVLAFLASASIGTLIGVTSLLAVAKLSAFSSKNAAAQMSVIRNLDSASDSFLNAQTAVRAAIQAPSDEGRENQLRRLNLAARMQDEAFARYLENDASSLAKAEIAVYQSSLDDYRNGVGEAERLIRIGKTDQATSVMTAIQTASTRISSALEKLSNISANEFEEVSTHELKIVSVVRWQITACILGGLLFSLGMALLIARDILRPIRELEGATKMIAQGNLTFSGVTARTDELGALARSFLDLAQNIRHNAITMTSIAAGDLNFEIQPGSEQDVVSKGLNSLAATIQLFIDETVKMSIQQEHGESHVFMDPDKFSGAFGEVANGLNRVVKSHFGANLEILGQVSEFGRGNFDAPIENSQHRKSFLNDTIEQVRANMKNLIADISKTSTAHVNGGCEVLIREETFQGDYKTIAAGINTIIAGHVNASRQVIEAVAELGDGNFDAHLSRLPGNSAIMNETFKRTRANLKHLLDKAQKISNYQSIQSVRLIQGLTRFAQGDSSFSIVVDPGDEDTAIARHTFQVLADLIMGSVDTVEQNRPRDGRAGGTNPRFSESQNYKGASISAGDHGLAAQTHMAKTEIQSSESRFKSLRNWSAMIQSNSTR